MDSELISRYSWKGPSVPRIAYAGKLERYKRRNKLTLDPPGICRGALGAEGRFFIRDEGQMSVRWRIHPTAYTFTTGAPHSALFREIARGNLCIRLVDEIV